MFNKFIIFSLIFLLNFDVSANSAPLENEIIVGVSFSIYKNEFDEFFNVLNKKYKLIRSEIPFFGNKYVEFQDNNCLITMDSPHMGEFMDVGYHDLNFLNKVAFRIKQKQKDQEQQNNKNF